MCNSLHMMNAERRSCEKKFAQAELDDGDNDWRNWKKVSMRRGTWRVVSICRGS